MYLRERVKLIEQTECVVHEHVERPVQAFLPNEERTKRYVDIERRAKVGDQC